jgi:hypothetical protein
MRRVHRVFLWAYDEEPGLVRSAATGDGSRAAYVGEVLGNFDKIVHPRREVTEVMPAVDKVMTAKELTEVTQHGANEFDRKFAVAYLGLILVTNPPGEREEFFKDVGATVRLAYRLIGRRLYRKQYATLFPGRPIPPTL